MEKLYSTTETAEALNIAMPTLRLWLRQQRVPYVRLGGKIMVKKSVIEKIMDGGLESVEPGR